MRLPFSYLPFAVLAVMLYACGGAPASILAEPPPADDAEAPGSLGDDRLVCAAQDLPALARRMRRPLRLRNQRHRVRRGPRRRLAPSRLRHPG